MTKKLIKSVFRVVFVQNDTVIELYAKQVAESDLFGFLVVEDFLFGEKSSLVVDPSEEKLKNLLSGVKRTFIPLQEIIRIDEVEKQGANKISPLPKGSSVSAFPQVVPSSKKGD